MTESLGGLYWLPVGVIAALIAALENAWVLLVEILR
jgi:modulator of FtsH protease